MCGIAFLFNTSLSSDEARARMEESLACQHHRGPDDQGIIQDQNVILGHRRLSIIDLAASRQPMLDQTGRYSLTYNGEIYNYRELRARLARYWQFTTNGDTEVLLAGLIQESSDFLKEIEGMWAFALWDAQEKRLLLARDRMGKKPLYYQCMQEQFLCASELPALRKLSTRSWQEDIDSTADYLRYGYYLPGFTAYENVHEVLPGHYLSWSPGKTMSQRPFWSITVDRFSGTRKQAAVELRSSLVRAVKRRLVADVEVGAFLSGGVDSSLVVSILAKKLKIVPKTFTIGFAERSYDEREYARLIADDCRTEHYVQVLDGWKREQLTSLVLDHIGQPFADSSLLPTHLVSAVAAEQVKVALSGDGGDELFSGYQRYQARSILRWYTRLPRPLRKGMGSMIRALPEPMAHHSRSLLKKAHLFQDIVDRLDAETPYTAPLLYSNAFFACLAPDLTRRGHQPPGLPEQTEHDDITRMMLADALIYLPQDILVKVDRASMACSLETRAPFLDSDVVQQAFSMPRVWHRARFSGKRMLKASFADLLPEQIWQRRKQGFGVPIHAWFRGELADELDKLVSSVDSPITSATVKTMIDQHQTGQRDQGYRLWNMYIYLLWRKQELG